MENNFYHILNRGVEKRKIFLNEKNYLRFLHNMEDLNDENVITQPYFKRRNNLNCTPSTVKIKNPLIKLICWCLMPNHFHILLKEVIENGAGLFSMKNTAGYTRHFNETNNRSGVLFQGKSKIIPIKDNNHFSWLPFYILANPLDLFQPDWREKGVKNPKKSFDFLLNYKWSNFSELLNNITDRTPSTVSNGNDIFYDTFNTNRENFRKDFEEWLINYRKFGDTISGSELF